MLFRRAPGTPCETIGVDAVVDGSRLAVAVNDAGVRAEALGDAAGCDRAVSADDFAFCD